MRFLRFGSLGSERPGVLDAAGRIRDLSSVMSDLAGPVLAELSRFKDSDINRLPLVESNQRIGQCVANVGKCICIGLNYADHAAETGQPIPEEPIIFMKATSALCGPDDDIIIPPQSQKTDWEVELGVVIGRELSHASETEAARAIAGYCIINDISERAFQLERGGQWTKGKSCDTFGPIGPWLVTPDEVGDPLNLNMWLEVDGHRYQDGSTSTMIFGPTFLAHYLSEFMTLRAGDVISTGTPPGVGLGQKPPKYLKPGQHMTVCIERLGVQHQRTVEYRGAQPVVR